MYENWGSEFYSRSRAGSFASSGMGYLEYGEYAYPDTNNFGDDCGDGYQWLFTLGAHNGFTEDGYADGHVKAHPTYVGADGMHHPSWFNDDFTSGSWEWDGKAPNAMHWDAQYH